MPRLPSKQGLRHGLPLLLLVLAGPVVGQPAPVPANAPPSITSGNVRRIVLPHLQPTPDDFGLPVFSNHLPLLDAELEPAEQDSMAVLLSQFTIEERLRLNQFLLAQPVGDRGAFARVLLDQPGAARQFLLRMLVRLQAVESQELARAIAGRVPKQWPALATLAEAVGPQTAVAVVLADSPAAGCRDVAADRQQACVQAAAQFTDVWAYGPMAGTNMELAKPGAAPWQAQLYRAGPDAARWLTDLARSQDRSRLGEIRGDWERLHLCGAVYLGHPWVLTAAHCIGTGWEGYNNEFFAERRVRIGTQDIGGGGQTWAISAVVRHGDYTSARTGNDIALLKLAGPPEGLPDEPIASVRLPAKPVSVQTPLRLTGWGITGVTNSANAELDQDTNLQRTQRFLRVGSIKAAPDSACNANPNFTQRGYRLVPGMICAGSDHSVDACRGDSGGPLVRLQQDQPAELIGLVSFGPGCGLPGTPGVYTDIHYFAAWVASAKLQAQDGKIIEFSSGACRHDGQTVACQPELPPRRRNRR